MTKTKCTWCNGEFEIESLRNEKSKREQQISGFCQECQDKTFGKD